MISSRSGVVFVVPLLVSTAVWAQPLVGPASQVNRNTASKQPSPSAGMVPQRASLVASEEIIPGEMSVSVFSHTLATAAGAVVCWSYVSHGLWALGQREIVFSVRGDPKEKKDAYPRDLLAFYKLIYGFAKQGRFVHAGDFTELGPTSPGLLGRRDFRGVLYTHPQVLEGVTVPSPFLTALILSEAELKVAREFGIVRMMAMLGFEYRFYPTAPWADQKRRVLAKYKSMEDSVIAKTPRAFVRGFMAVQEIALASQEEHGEHRGPPDAKLAFKDSRLLIRIQPNARKILRELIEPLHPGGVLTILADFDSSAEACLTWHPSQTGISAIWGEGRQVRRIAGNFVTFLPGVEENGGLVIEDGFVLKMTAETWKTLRASLTEGRPASVPPTEDGMALEISWLPSDYQDPITGRSLIAEEGWEIHRPQDSKASLPGLVAVSESAVVLLTSEEEASQRIEASTLGGFVNEITRTVDAYFQTEGSRRPLDLVVECELMPGGRMSFVLAFRPQENALEAIAQGLHARLSTLTAPAVSHGPVKFQVLVALWGGTGKPLSPILDQ